MPPHKVADPSESAPKRVRRSAEEAKRVILDAAEKRLREGGPEAIRLQDIARDVGISHPAILHHFESRDGLTAALERRAMERLAEDLVAAFASRTTEGTVIEVIERVFEVLGRSGHARMLAWRVLQTEDPDPMPPDWHLLRPLADRIHVQRCEMAQESGRPEPDVADSEFVVRLAAAAILGEGVFAPFLDDDLLGREGDEESRRSFRTWFARLIAEHTGIPRQADPSRP